MSRAPKNNWRPSASITNLQLRARVLQSIRQFFAERNVLEVETPLVCHTSVTDPHIQSIPVAPLQTSAAYYLQTSPEYAMKRLLAAGCDSIYQISKAFRQAEVGRLHNPEFTLLEWYRVGFTHHDLMNEVDELLQVVLQTSPAERITYANLFQQFLNIDPHHASLNELRACAKQNSINVQEDIVDHDTWLDLLNTHCIEAHLGQNKPCFVYDFPASQAALARIIASNPPVAARFEVYLHGSELANGFYELKNAAEQRLRFEKNNQQRKQLGLNEMLIDELFLSALEAGLPDCAGVALGIDRLLMIAAKSDSIQDVLAFDFSRV